MAEHIHWKKTTNPDYLGTFAFEKKEEPAKENLSYTELTKILALYTE